MGRSIRKAILFLMVMGLAVAACGAPNSTTTLTPTASLPTSVSSTSASDSVAMDELIAAARREGKVTVYSVTSRIKDVVQAFEGKFPGIKVTQYQIASTEMISRIKSEVNANVYSARVESGHRTAFHVYSPWWDREARKDDCHDPDQLYRRRDCRVGV